MSNAQLFLYPGEVLAEFALSLFAVGVSEFDPGLYALLCVVAALFFWAWVMQLCSAVVKKMFGFEQGRR